MTSLFDASFIINVKKTDLHKYWHRIFPRAVISSQIEAEIVMKGRKLERRESILTLQQIAGKSIAVEEIEDSQIHVIEKVVHKGEASLVSVMEQLQEQNYLVGTDDRVFWRYLTYMFPLKSEIACLPFTSLDLVAELVHLSKITVEEARVILQQLDRIGAHPPEAIMEAYAELENTKRDTGKDNNQVAGERRDNRQNRPKNQGA